MSTSVGDSGVVCALAMPETASKARRRAQPPSRPKPPPGSQLAFVFAWVCTLAHVLSLLFTQSQRSDLSCHRRSLGPSCRDPLRSAPLAGTNNRPPEANKDTCGSRLRHWLSPSPNAHAFGTGLEASTV